MKKSKLRLIIKTALLTFGILSFFAGLLSPITYYLGKEADASCDYASFTEISDGIYRTDISYHFYTSGKEHNGIASFEGPLDESVSLKKHTVKYLPFFPGYNFLKVGYSIPTENIIISSLGLVSFITGLFIKTSKKEKKQPEETAPNKMLFLCPACECEIDKDSIFCNYCGRKLIRKG